VSEPQNGACCHVENEMKTRHVSSTTVNNSQRRIPRDDAWPLLLLNTLQ